MKIIPIFDVAAIPIGTTRRMKAFIIIVITVLCLIVIYLLWVKLNRKEKVKKINEILLKRHLGETVEAIDKSIRSKKFELFLAQYENEGFKYVITNTPTQRTSTIYQFQDNKCTSFAIESSEEWYSLPSWRYAKEYVNNTQNIPFRLSPKDDSIQLAGYTIDKFLEPFEDTEAEFTRKLDYFFKKYYRVDGNRYLSIDLDKEQSRIRPYPVYLYLCSCRVDYMEILREQLYKTDNTIPKV